MPGKPSSEGFVGRALSWLLAFLVISAAYLYAFPQANIFYAGIVLLHTLAGVATAILLIRALYPRLRKGSALARTGWLLIATGSILGLILIKTGTAPHYARARFESHLARFRRLEMMLQTGAIDEAWLKDVEDRDNIFPNVPLDWIDG